MTDYDHAICRQVNVELESVGSCRQPLIEGGKGILRTQRTTASVREYLGLGIGEKGHSLAGLRQPSHPGYPGYPGHSAYSGH